MDRFFFPACLFVVEFLLNSCSGSQNSGTPAEVQAYQDAIIAASNAEIAETKLLSEFRIGMSESQVDSVVKILYQENKLIHWLDVNSDYAPIRDESEYTIDLSYYIFSDNGKEYYLSMHPQYVNSKLSQLFCTIKNKKGQKDEQPLHLIFSILFENSTRGKSFRKFELSMLDEKGNVDGKIMSFIKDNLEVLFYPQKDSNIGSIQYINVPEAHIRQENTSQNEL